MATGGGVVKPSGWRRPSICANSSRENQRASSISLRSMTIVSDSACAWQPIINELGKGNRLEFRDFGVFETKVRKARKAQNPKTLEPVEVPEKRTVKFKVGRLMKAKLAGMTGVAIDDEAGDIDDMSDGEDHEDDTEHDEAPAAPKSNSGQAG